MIWVLGCILGSSLACTEILNQLQEFRDRAAYFRKAYSISRQLNKPMLLVGRPKARHPCADYNLDIDPEIARECPNWVIADARNIPFPDGFFGSLYVGHVIEHIPNPWAALMEFQRVSDYVVVLYPRYSSWLARLHPDHVSLHWCWAQLGLDGVFEYGRFLGKLIKIEYATS